MAPIIELRHVDKHFGDLHVLKDVSLSVGKGEVVVVIGPSGSGKSTLCRAINRLETIDSGEILIEGKPLPQEGRELAAMRAELGMVFQSYALYPHMTVRGNMEFPLKLRKLPKEEIDRRVNQAAEILGITEYLERKPKALSGGQRQRVAIGRAIVREPKVLLMDEPLSNLDAKLRNQMRAEIIKLRQRINATFIYVTHDQTEAMTLGDRIVIMKDGVIQQIGTPQEVFDHPVNLFVAGFIGVPQMNFYDAELKWDEDGVYSVLMGGIRVVPTVEKQERLHQASVPPQEIILGVRPEHIMLLENGEHGVHGKVEVSEMMGSAVHLHVDINGRDSIIVAQTSGMDGAQYIPSESGTSISFIFGGNVVHLFSKKDGHNLEF